ncbi:MAG: heme ABC exporter ATP-binding protein CcmA [Pseudomonadota bacterium]
MLISVKDLVVARGGRTLLTGICFGLDREQALHVAGSNGSGKTSLLESLCGLRAPEHGSVEGLESADVFHWIGHKNALNPALTVVENLRFWCRVNNASEDRIENALDRLQLRAQQHRACRELSVGQRRRAALARLLAVRRPLWLLDEPLSGLDAGGVDLFIEMLKAHLALGGAAIITSHQNLPPLNGMRRLQL